MNTDPFRSYRENTVRGSIAADIYIQCYDEVIRLLHSAARAIDAGEIEKKTRDLNRVLAFIVHLQAALDAVQHDESVGWLSQFYVLVRKQIFEASARLSPDLLRQAAGYFADMRKLWEEARTMSAGKPASNPSLSPQRPLLHSSQKVAPTIASDMAETFSRSGWSA